MAAVAAGRDARRAPWRVAGRDALLPSLYISCKGMGEWTECGLYALTALNRVDNTTWPCSAETKIKCDPEQETETT